MSGKPLPFPPIKPFPGIFDDPAKARLSPVPSTARPGHLADLEFADSDTFTSPRPRPPALPHASVSTLSRTMSKPHCHLDSALSPFRAFLPVLVPVIWPSPHLIYASGLQTAAFARAPSASAPRTPAPAGKESCFHFSNSLATAESGSWT